MNKVNLYRLIDGLPDNKIPQVQAYLETIHAGGLKALLANAPEEDEEISPEEEAAVQQAEADIAANGVLSNEDVRKILGL